MKKTKWYVLFVAGIVLSVGLGFFVFREKAWSFLTVAVLFISCLFFLARLEEKEMSIRRIVVIAVMTAISVTGRFLFAVVPGFKPVTAVVVITGMYCGYDAGFICGAFSAVISNCYFGQGPWTPFQMTAWGVLGLLAGVLGPVLKKKKVLLLGYGIFAGTVYSFFMDIWTVLWYNGSWKWTLYLMAVTSAVPCTVSYAVSNVIFLGVLEKPMGRKLKRMKQKYGI